MSSDFNVSTSKRFGFCLLAVVFVFGIPTRVLASISQEPQAAAMSEPQLADGQAFTLFQAGDFLTAAEEAALAAEAAQSGSAVIAANFVLAARALNAEAYFEQDRKTARRTANKALDLAEAGIEANPDLVEAHLQAAIALSLRAGNMSAVKALFLNLPSRARREIDAALAIDQENAWALSTSAAWRVEVARRGGGSVFGADPDEGFEEFLRARALMPENVSIAYECALRLLAGEREEWREVALEALAVAIAGTPASAYEAALQRRATGLQRALEAGPATLRKFIDEND
ncbi:MAG: hypothetical protein AAFR21_12495 [Pseudomonadota bacterium]